MDNRRNHQNKNNKNNRKRNNLFPLIAATLVLTVGIQYLSLYLGGAASKATTQEIKYSEFIQLVESGDVDEVLLRGGNLEITLEDGATYTNADGREFTHKTTLFTVQIPHDELVPWLKEHDVEFTEP